MPRLLNLGCGSRFCDDPAWTNIDLRSWDPRVIRHNLLEGIPCPNESFDAVYHSHLLEHLGKVDGASLMRECFRVLKPGGVVRVAVPDLEQICRLYLQALERVEAGQPTWGTRYEWIKLEMYDQAVRSIPGGNMGQFLTQPDLPDREFIVSRIGSVGRDAIESPSAARAAGRRPAMLRSPTTLVRRAQEVAASLRWRIVSIPLTKREREALRLGLFRQSGEVHLCMYDRYSLRTLLETAGFERIEPCTASESKIANWRAYYLDQDPDGFEHAPSSLYMEGMRPR